MLNLRLLLLVAFALGPAALPAATPLNQERIQQVAAWLPATPETLGRPATDRAYWDRLKQDHTIAATIAAARTLKTKPIPDIPDDLYLEFSRNGNRSNYERQAFERRNRFTPLVLAECLENTGEFVPAVEALITRYCDEKTWVLPAHDKKLTNFENKLITVDLFSSALGWNLATADYLLGSKLNPALRDRLRLELDRRILTPFRNSIRGTGPLDRWLIMTNNWNPVCFAGVVGTGLLQMPKPLDRAEFIVAAEYYSRYFLDGFTEDGYCSEGVGYWNYGFGRYALLSEMVRHATSGRLDFLTSPTALMPAQYGARIQVINGVAPSFSDCAVGARVSDPLMWHIKRRLKLPVAGYEPLHVAATLASLPEALIYQELLTQMPNPPAPTGSAPTGESLRTWFDKAGVYVGRPASPNGMGVALKGGNNDEHHNHNDIGSFVAILGHTSVLLDPGTEPYTKRTFSPQRYESNLLNSFGHPVPLIDGKLQDKGKQAQGKLLSSNFTNTTDTLTFDIKSAYTVPSLQTLNRTFQYGREGSGTLVIIDDATFTTPTIFETAILTAGEVQTLAPDTLICKDGDQAVRVTVQANSRFEFVKTRIEETSSIKPWRVAIRLLGQNGKLTTARCQVTVTPVP